MDFDFKDFNYKIIFWMLAIAFYIYTQIKDSFKKDNRTDPIPNPIPKLPSIPGMNQNRPQPKPVPETTYPTSIPAKTSKKYQSKYNKEVLTRDAFYTEEVKKPVVINYEDSQSNNAESESLFGVDQHLKPYELQTKEKHPLITFLSNKNNLKNAFITGEILKRRD